MARALLTILTALSFLAPQARAQDLATRLSSVCGPFGCLKGSLIAPYLDYDFFYRFDVLYKDIWPVGGDGRQQLEFHFKDGRRAKVFAVVHEKPFEIPVEVTNTTCNKDYDVTAAADCRIENPVFGIGTALIWEGPERRPVMVSGPDYRVPIPWVYRDQSHSSAGWTAAEVSDARLHHKNFGGPMRNFQPPRLRCSTYAWLPEGEPDSIQWVVVGSSRNPETQVTELRPLVSVSHVNWIREGDGALSLTAKFRPARNNGRPFTAYTENLFSELISQRDRTLQMVFRKPSGQACQVVMSVPRDAAGAIQRGTLNYVGLNRYLWNGRWFPIYRTGDFFFSDMQMLTDLQAHALENIR